LLNGTPWHGYCGVCGQYAIENERQSLADRRHELGELVRLIREHGHREYLESGDTGEQSLLDEAERFEERRVAEDAANAHAQSQAVQSPDHLRAAAEPLPFTAEGKLPYPGQLLFFPQIGSPREVRPAWVNGRWKAVDETSGWVGSIGQCYLTPMGARSATRRVLSDLPQLEAPEASADA
jgi:hypothetical protein